MWPPHAGALETLRSSLLPFALALATVGCESKPSASVTAPAVASAAAPAKAEQNPAQLFGEPLSAGPARPLGSVLAAPDDFAGKTVVVEGEVRRVCTRKGCWLELAEGLAPDKPGCRVTFKDYAFFVPTSSGGAHAKVQGVVNVEQVKASHVRHLEEEGATFASKAADGTAREVRLVATGVELRHN